MTETERVPDETTTDESATHASVDQLRQEIAAAQDRELRALAEMENIRRRMRREMQEERKYACQPLLADLLPVLDNVQRAIAASEQSDPESRLLTGVRMVAQQLESVLQRHDCQRIAAQGEPFDPALHEAIAQQPSHDLPAGTVLHVAMDGYRLHDRVVRPSQVIVSQTPTS